MNDPKENTMTAPTTISIDSVDYIRADTIDRPPATTRIVVLQRGWVIVGHYHENGDEVTVTNASVIRVWGTTKGLGELVDDPTGSTKLDPCGVARAHRGAVVLTLDVDQDAWEAHL